MPHMAPLPTPSAEDHTTWADRRDLAARDEDGRADDLAVVTADPAFAVVGLRLPFSRARVVWLHDPEVGGALDALTPGRYETVLLDAESLDPRRRGDVLRRAVESVRPGGRVVIALDVARAVASTSGTPPAGSDAPAEAADHAPGPATAAAAPGSPAWSTWETTWETLSRSVPGLRWRGVGTLDGRLCAILRREEGLHREQDPGSADDVAGRLATLEQAVTGVGHLLTERWRVECQAHRRERHDSEAALLAHLRSVADALEEERRRRGAADRRYETLLKRYKDLEKRHDRLLSSKLGTLTVRYWRLRKKLRGLVGPSGGA
ncbi:hypothetical protein DFJ64_0798 [Thermasporomyces composti]|uniref:Uncharacterized protein n=2 Tax=Thermasporomyces composti TaxID=696763 RepID=A0A3D9V1T8_THECX|nr:hypothetical protein DFJ64_0798 [Thermasporomyces composti]